MLGHNRKSTTLHRRVKPAEIGRHFRQQAWPTRSPPAARPYHPLGNYLFREQIWEESEGLLVGFFPGRTDSSVTEPRSRETEYHQKTAA